MISPQRNRISADGNEFFFWAFLTDKDTPNGTDFCPRSTLLFLYKVAYKKSGECVDDGTDAVDGHL